MEPEKSAVDLLHSSMRFSEQFVEKVLSYSSRYNSTSSIMYAPENLIGKPSEYPRFGDFPDTYLLRTYGNWWREREAAQPEYMPHDVDPVAPDDFVVVRYQSAIFPKNVCIYETFHPGAVIKIWGRLSGQSWHLLWSGLPQGSIYRSRRFAPPINPINKLINELRLEFNQSNLTYHTSLDGILLTGYSPLSRLQMDLIQKGFLDTFITDATEVKKEQQDSVDENSDLISKLPFEIMVHIFEYLDLKSLCRCAQVNKKWYSVSLNPALYRAISLKKYWHKIDNTIMEYFMKRCKNVKKLDLSWCGDDNQIEEVVFVQFLQECCRNITHLSLACCNFIHPLSIIEIGKCTEISDLRLRDCTRGIQNFEALAHLEKLTALDLCSSHIKDDQLIGILKANQNLKHLLIDFCYYLEALDEVAQVASVYNRNLISWSSWKTSSFTSEGIGYLAECSSLRELDLGWCLNLNEPGNCLEKIAIQCKDLKRLIICGWRGLSDPLLLPVITYSKELIQLDLLGIKNVTKNFCETILISLPNLRLLDLSFCNSLSPQQVDIWRERYPHVTIQFF